MTERVAISVSLTPELHGFAKELVNSGSYGSTSEVVRAGLRLLREREAGSRQGLQVPRPNLLKPKDS